MRAFARLEAYPIPPYIVEISTWHVRDAVGENRYSYRFAVRTSDGMENATSYPIPGKALPSHATIDSQFVGPLAWLVRPVRSAKSAPDAQIGPDVPNLKNIASVVAFRPDYAIDLVGVESVDGHQVYHLRLRPYGDASKHNLRELWVDVATFDLWKATFVGSCAPCAGPTTITSVFTPAAGAWIVAHYSFLSGCGGLDASTCAFDLRNDAVVFVPELPDWLFDKAAYMIRARANEPDFLATVIDARLKEIGPR